MTSRRFPAPWRADKIAGGYVVRDANGQALAYLEALVVYPDGCRRSFGWRLLDRAVVRAGD
jgi:hypothetical protein